MNKFTSLLMLSVLSALGVAGNDHGLGKLKALVKRLHDKYDKPMNRLVSLMSDEEYRQKKHREDLIREYRIV